MIPISVLPMMMGKKVRSRKDPTRISSTAMMAKTRLKYVKRLLLTISRTVLEGGSTGVLAQPFSIRCVTWAALRPVLGSAWIRSRGLR